MCTTPAGTDQNAPTPSVDLAALYEGLQWAVAILDRSGRVLRMNRAARDLAAPEAPSPIGTLLCEAPWWNSSDDRDAVRRSIEQSAAGARRESVEVHAGLPGGDMRTLLLTVRPLPDTRAETLLIAEAADVTEQREGEAALHSALAQHRSVLDCILHPLVIIDAMGIIQTCSRAITRVFGYEPSELIGKNVSILMPEPHRTAHDGYLAAYRRTGKSHILDHPREFQAVHKDGSTFPIELNVTRADIPGQRLPLFAGLMRDLTAEKRASAELYERDRRVRRMLETSSLIAVILDATGRITFINDAFLMLTGWQRHEVIGADWFARFIPASVRERVRGVFQDALHDGRIVTPYENEILTRSGARRLVQWNNSVLQSPEHEGAIGVTSIGVDVTDQRRDEAELRAHRERLAELVKERTDELEASHDQLRAADHFASMGALAAGLGHDMGNIVFPTICRLDVVEAGVADPALRREVREIRASLDYLRRLAEGLHLLAMNPDAEEETGDATDIGDWWQSVEPMITRAASQRGQFAVSIPAGLPMIGVGSHLLTQAVFNLVVNAAAAIATDGHIGLDAHADGDRVLIAVRDDGVGMTEAVRRRAIEPFFTTRKRGLGTGLGLSLAQAVAGAAGGDLRIDSAPGRGTTVTLSFPAVEPAASAPRRATLTIADPRSRAFIASLLAAAGVETSPASGPEDAADGVWVADATDETLATARHYLAGGPGGAPHQRRVVLIGADEDMALPPGGAVVGTMAAVDRLRQALNEAACTPTG